LIRRNLACVERYPLAVSCGREVLAALLRPGNAGANDAEDHVHLLELAFARLPPAALDGRFSRARNSAGVNHVFADACRETRIRFSLGYGLTSRCGPRSSRWPSKRGGRRSTLTVSRQTGVGRRADRRRRPSGVADRHAACLPT
jgi:hypothetical protein